MDLIKGISVIAVLLILACVMGNAVSIWLKTERKMYRSAVYGFVVMVALFQIIATPAILLKWKFNTLAALYSVIFLATISVSLYVSLKNREKNKLKEYIKKLYGQTKGVLLFLIAVMAIFQIFCSTYLNHTDADDGYFVTVSNMAIENNEIELEGNYVYTGMPAEKISVRPEISAWELFIGYIAKLSDMHPAILTHSILPALLIMLSYMAVYNIGDKIFENKKSKQLFIFFYMLLNLFGGYAVYSTGCFLLLRIWQGKVMLANFAIPLLIGNCIDIYKEKDTIHIWVMNLFIVITGICFTVVGVYLMPIAYLITGLPYIIKTLYEKRFDRFRSTIIRAAVTMIPVIILVGYLFVRLMSAETGSSYTKQIPQSWDYTFSITMMQGSYFILFLFSIVYMLTKMKNKVETLICVGMTAGLFLTFLNPLFAKPVAQKITGVDVYWRLYWVLPVYITVSIVMSEWLSDTGRLQKMLAICVIAILVSKSGVYMYNDTFFAKHQNKYKIPEKVVNVVRYVVSEEENAVCMFPEDMSYYARQYTSDIKVPMARGMSVSKKSIGKTDKTYSWLYNEVYVNMNIRDEYVQSLLKEIKADYVYIPYEIENNCTKVDDYGYVVKIE